MRLRPIALLAAVAAGALAVACADLPTGPEGAGIKKSFGVLAFAPEFASQGVPGAPVVRFAQVRVILSRADGSVALDAVRPFPSGATEASFDFEVPLAAGTGASGESFTLTLELLDAAGGVLFRGTQQVTITPTAPGSTTPPPPITVPVRYAGPGANATRVRISPRDVTVRPGETRTFTAVAEDASGTPVPGTPIGWRSTNPSVVQLPDPTTGRVIAGSVRGSAQLQAVLITGQTDAVTIAVVPPPSGLTVASGNGQTGGAGTVLPQPLVAVVTATDGIGVAGVPVTFAASGGALSGASVITDADGRATTTLTLPGTPGTVTVTATSAAVPGASAVFTATVVPGPLDRLRFVAPPAGVAAGEPFSVSVEALDRFGNRIVAFTGEVALALSGGTAGAVLSGTTAVAAAGGVASFSGLRVDRGGTGYTLTASASGATSAAITFDVASRPAARLVFAGPIAGARACAVVPAFRVEARDDRGNLATDYAGVVTVNVASGPVGSTAGGSQTVRAERGVATFNGLRLDRAGSGYVLSAQAVEAGVQGALSPPFAVTHGDPQRLLVVQGAGQTAAPSAALPQPIVVRVVDCGSNPVPGVPVSFTVRTGGGVLSASTATTDANGEARVGWTLGPTAGAQQIAVSAPGVPDPVLVGANASLPATATQLVITTQPATTMVAGTTGTIVVEARDALNVLVPTYAGTATLSFSVNPGGGPLTGTVTAVFVGGVATLNAWSIPTAAAEYVLQVTSGALTPCVTTPFSVVPAAASTIALHGGNGQTGAPSAPLPTPLRVIVRDAFSNPVSGYSVTWIVTGGGGILPSATLTNAAGVASASWTLGPAGPQSAQAIGAGLTGSPVGFTATAAIAGLATWTGAVSTAWNVAGNWSPAAVPTPGDSVRIPNTTNHPVLSSSVTLAGLRLEPGAQLNIGAFTLEVQGHLDAGTTIVGAGTVTLTSGSAATVRGAINGPLVVVNGSYTLSGNLSIGGNLQITGGTLGISTHALSVTGHLSTTGAGVLNQTGVGSQVTIGGNATFAGGSTAGALTAGTMDIAGNFVQGPAGSPAAFVASGTHVVRFTGTSPTISFSVPATSRFNNLVFTGSGVPDFLTNAHIGGTVEIQSTMITGITGVGRTVTLNGGLDDPIGGRWQVANTQVDAPGLVTFTPSLTTNLTLLGSTEVRNLQGLTGSLSIQGNARYTHTSGVGATITGNLLTSAAGTYSRTAGTVTVNGNVSFSGGSTTGLLTGGTLQVAGQFAQAGGVPTAFRADSGHLTRFLGTGPQSVSFSNGDTLASRFGQVEFNPVAGSIALNSNVAVAAAVTVASGTFSVTHPGNHALVVQGNVSTAPGTLFSPNRLYLSGTLSVAGTFAPDTVEWGGTGTLPPGAINYVYGIRGARSLSGTLTVSAPGSVYVAGTGALTVTGSGTLTTPAFSTLNAGTLVMTAAGAQLNVAGNALFDGGNQTGLLTAGTLTVGGNVTVGQTNSPFAFNATPGHTTVLTPASGVTLSMQNADPSGVTGNRFGTLTFTGAGVTTMATDVAVAGTVTMAAGSGGTTGLARLAVGGLVDPTGQKNQNASVEFYSGCGTLPDSMRTNVIFSAPCSLPHNFRVTNGGSVLVFGASAHLDVNNRTLRTVGGGVLDVQGPNARLIMDGPTDTVVISGYARFRGGPSAGFLTAGYLQVAGNFTQADDFGFSTSGFAASGAHTVALAGTTNQVVSFSHPGYAQSRFGKLILANKSPAGVTFASNAYVASQLIKPAGFAATDSLRLFATGQVLYAQGVDIEPDSVRHGIVVFDRLRFQIDDGPFAAFGSAVFRNFTATPFENQFTVNRSSGTITAARLRFATAPASTYNYIAVLDPDGATGGWSGLTVRGPAPPCGDPQYAGKIALGGSTTYNCIP